MGIRFQCPNGHKLNVKADLAGKRASCPECGVKLVIPAASPQPSAVPVAAPDAHGLNQGGSRAEPPNRTWLVRPARGGQFGPANDATFRAWITDGRVAADSQVRRDDWAEWKLARDAVDDLPIPLAAVPVAATTPEVPPPQPAEKAEVPVVPEPLPVAVVDSLPSDAAPIPATPLAAPLAATQYKLQRSKSQRTQVTLAIVMLVAVIVLAGVLVWVIRSSGGPTGAASIQTTTRPAAVDLSRAA